MGSCRCVVIKLKRGQWTQFCLFPQTCSATWYGHGEDVGLSITRIGAMFEGKELTITPEMAAETVRIIEACHAENPLSVEFE